VIDRTATARIQRLMRWLEPVQSCFGHRAQRLALRTYVHRVFSDSERKSMQAMLTRVTQPVSYQGFQHVITHAPWDADRIWRRLLDVLPERRGVLIIDSTSCPKQGPHSVGVARQYCGALGKIANCQVAVTAALWTGVRAWFLGARLYLPEEWLTPERRQPLPASHRTPLTRRAPSSPPTGGYGYWHRRPMPVAIWRPTAARPRAWLYCCIALAW
jgi:SRSO17 transposase